MKKTCAAIVLSAGKGKRMNSKVHKQYLEILGKPVIYYALKAFEDSSIIDEIILVTGEGEEEYCQKEIVEKYDLKKVTKIVTGGKERYESVYNGLLCLKDNGYVFIHDGARPFVDGDIIDRAYQGAKEYKACVVGMPVKDTIKFVDSNKMVEGTPDRSRMWQVQTPQVFDTQMIKKAYQEVLQNNNVTVTDDAMVWEQVYPEPVKMVEGSYNNIKITTPEDLEIASVFAAKN